MADETPATTDYDGLLRLAGRISREAHLEGLLEMILTESVPWMKVEACSIFLPEKLGGDLIIHSAFGDSAPRLHDLRVPAGKGIVGAAMEEKRMIRVDDVASDPRFYRKADEETGWVTRALVAAPLLDGEECLGVIEFLNPVGRPAFSAADERLVEYFAGLIAAALVRVRAQAAVVERAALQRDLDLASELQAGLLPKAFPGPAQSPQIEVFARLDPAREVSGDLYDFFFLDDDHLCFVVGDVSGKGVAAGLFMAVTRTMVRAVARPDRPPAEVLTRVNRELCRENDACLFVTMILGVANVKTGDIVCGLAGHNPPAVVRCGGGAAFGPVGGQPMGLNDKAVFTEWAVSLAEGDALVVYTDGVTEAMDEAGRLFGNEPLRLVLDRGGESSDAIVQEVSRAVELHVDGAERSDDITILVLRRREG
jgi:serine phosphatase RsbU (regulator of sigma subunit)/putative methionine-R-sulfoxide reductase with GAF domain